jgi:energy-coupling factor transporter ATP-binding protein EcfA2
MAISRVEIKDFLVFKGDFAVDFCPGVNVLIGGNATGKTTLLREMYGKRNHFYQSNEFAEFRMFFDGKLLAELVTPSPIKDSRSGSIAYVNTCELNNIVFIPESNIISHSRGLPETVRYGKLNYNISEIGIVEKARVLPSVPKQALVQKIEDIIGAETYLAPDGQSFVVKRKDLNYEIELLFEASGYQKFALLALLIHNEQISPGTILFWDEPENSLNPELVPKLVDILLELAQNGVQIFIATHDYNLARYFDVRKNKDIPVMFHGLTKIANGQIVCDSSPEYIKLPNNLLEIASADLFKAVVNDAMETEDND